MDQLFNVTVAASFWGTVLALTMFWGGFQTVRYELKGEPVPKWAWVAVFVPLAFGGLATVLAAYG